MRGRARAPTLALELGIGRGFAGDTTTRTAPGSARPVLVTHDRSDDAKRGHGNQDEDPQDTQDRPDDAEDATGIGETAAAGVHGASIDLFEVAAAHDPGWYSGENAAQDQAQDPQDEDESAAMWFHRLIRSCFLIETILPFRKIKLRK